MSAGQSQEHCTRIPIMLPPVGNLQLFSDTVSQDAIAVVGSSPPMPGEPAKKIWSWDFLNQMS